MTQLSQRVLSTIRRYAAANGLQKVILFGSRACGTNAPRSDVDLAVSGGDCEGFYWAIKEQAPTLLSFDFVFLDKGISEELRKEIERDGVTLYEKAG